MLLVTRIQLVRSCSDYGIGLFANFWLKRKPPQPVVDHPNPLLPGSLRSRNSFQTAYFWRLEKGK